MAVVHGNPMSEKVFTAFFRGDTNEVLLRTVGAGPVPRTGDTLELNGVVYHVDHVHWKVDTAPTVMPAFIYDVSVRLSPVR